MDTQTIPQLEVVFKTEQPTNGGCCQFCNSEAEPNTVPPLCALHLDWVMLVSFMQRRSMPITPESVKTHLAKCQTNGGDWLLTEADVDRLWQQFNCNGFEAELATEKATFAGQVAEAVNGR